MMPKWPTYGRSWRMSSLEALLRTKSHSPLCQRVSRSAPSLSRCHLLRRHHQLHPQLHGHARCSCATRGTVVQTAAVRAAEGFTPELPARRCHPRRRRRSRPRLRLRGLVLVHGSTSPPMLLHGVELDRASSWKRCLQCALLLPRPADPALRPRNADLDRARAPTRRTPLYRSAIGDGGAGAWERVGATCCAASVHWSVWASRSRS